MMLKMVWVPVCKIHRCPTMALTEAQESDTKFISIAVEQAERHEIFVASISERGIPGNPVAVGSSDRLLGSLEDWTVSRNTFLDFPLPHQ
jgi:hypothetical protein